jgi:hypothetical protein
MAADILYVDDDPGPLLGRAEKAGQAGRFDIYDVPRLETLTRASLQTSTAWVLDFYNDEDSVDTDTFAATKETGLSLFQRLRLLAGETRPPAILISNHLERALGRAVIPGRRHRLAEDVGVEWVAEKAADHTDTLAEILQISDATGAFVAAREKLANADPPSYVETLASTLLALPSDAQWASLALNDLDDWRPPTWVEQDTAGEKDGEARGDANARPFVAWIIRQVLPYPSFVISVAHVAARLKVSTESLRKVLESENGLSRKLGERRYAGVMSGFGGGQWWAAGVDALVFDLPRAKEERQAALTEMAGPGILDFLDIADPVVVSDADLVETDQIASADDCVRASDEHAPSHAPPAWVLAEAARKDRALARRVWLEDQPNLAANE